MAVRNLADIRARDPKLYEALEDIIRQQTNLEQQTNGNTTGQPLAPPSISALNVTAQNGHFNIAISDEGNIYRGVQYYVEHADNPQFTNPTVIHLGDSRNHNEFLGNVTRYFRAYSSYGSSPAGAPAYHGGASNPQPVAGGGSIGGPDFLPSQGSGTGAAGQGLSGPGPVPFRSHTGAPPVRGENGTQSGSGGGLFFPSPLTGVPNSSQGTEAPGGGGGVSSIYVDPHTLTAASTTINHPISGLLWLVILRQDATGGRNIAWGAGISAASANIDTTPSSISTFLFAYDNTVNLWVMVGQLTTGMTP